MLWDRNRGFRDMASGLRPVPLPLPSRMEFNAFDSELVRWLCCRGCLCDQLLVRMEFNAFEFDCTEHGYHRRNAAAIVMFVETRFMV